MNNTCPKCQTLVHETKPYQNIRSDPTLQDIVYKVVPGLYKNEMGRRRKVYEEHPEAAKTITSGEEKGEYSGERTIYSPEDIIPISLQYVPLEINYTYHGPNGSPSSSGLPSAVTTTSGEHGQVRYLKCVSAVTVRILKKLLRNKFDLKYHHDVELYYRQDPLLDTYSILDLAYIYSWKKTSPLSLYYKITDLRTSAYARNKTRSACTCKAGKKDDIERQTLDAQPITSITQPQSLDAVRQEVSEQLKVNPSPSTSLSKTEHVRSVVNGDKRSLPPTAAKMPQDRPKVKKSRLDETTKHPRLTSVHIGSNISKNKNIAVKKPVRPVMVNEIVKSSANQPNGLSKSHAVAEVSETSKVAETNVPGTPTIFHRVSPLQTGHNGEKKQLSNGKSVEELPKNIPFTQPSSSLTSGDLNRLNRSDSLDAIRRQITSLPFTASPPLPLRPEPIRPLIQDDTSKKNSPISMVKPMKSVHDDGIPRPVSIEPLRAPIQDEAAKKYVALNAALALAPSGISMEPLRPIPSELPKSPLPHVNGVSEGKRTHIREDVSKSPIPRVLNGTSASTESNTITTTNRTAVKSSEDKAASLCKNAVSHVIQYDKYDSSDILLKLENCIKKSSQ